tara:strand:- start:1123 stop:1551 length:429 start_codon:yes stop_codon:yes gene_type:complete
MKRCFSRLVIASLFFSASFSIPLLSHDLSLKNNYSKSKKYNYSKSKTKKISCKDQENLVQDFERSFDYKERALIDRVNEKNNFIDFWGIGPNRFPENRMVQESKRLWDTFECHLSKFSKESTPESKDIFNGFNSSLSGSDLD